MSSSCKTNMWFRRDLRIEDNPALAFAAIDGNVLAVFIWCPKEEGQFYPGRVSRWWLKQSLIHLDRSLRSLGIELKLIKTQSTISSLLECIDSVGANKLAFNHLYGLVAQCTIEELGLEIESEKSSNALLGRRWSPGWSNADKVLNEFVKNHLLDYSKQRHKVGITSTSLLSPYLHFGELSVRKVYHSVWLKKIRWAEEKDTTGEESSALYLRCIGLREYSRYICFNFPYTHERSLVGSMKYFPWNSDQAHFKAWRQGRTGYPLVDAGMRELWATGWIHNRIRVIVSCFLVKFLILPWQWGMKYFWDTLIDADLECDSLGWQYISGGLPGGHELDCLDSPQVQGFKYDPDGEYVRQWLPELARMPTVWIHHPWNAPPNVLKSAGIELGQNYPKPIVDIDIARDRLTEAILIMRGSEAAARAADSNWTDEVVFENTDESEEIVLKLKSTCPTTSSHDQRVPSFQKIKNVELKKKKQKPMEDESKLQVLQVNECDLSGVVDRLSSTESSSKRQATSSTISFSVPQTSNQTEIESTLQGHECYFLKQQDKGEKDMENTCNNGK